MRLTILLLGACLVDLGLCRPVARARDPFFTRPRAPGTYFYNVDLMVDTPTDCSEFHDSLVTKVVFRTALSATLNEIAEAAGRPGFIVNGAARCRDSTSGSDIRLIQVYAESQPGTDAEFAGQVFNTFMHGGGVETFFRKLKNRMANMEGALDEFGSAVLATYSGDTANIGLNTQTPHKHEFNSETDLEIQPCRPDWDATCPTLCYCSSGKCTGDSGICTLTNPGECVADADCKDPSNPICGKIKCDTQTAKCVYAPATTPCTHPFLYGRESVCSGTGFCRICSTGADCAGSQQDAACYTCDLILDECLPANDGHTCSGVSVYGTLTGICSGGRCVACIADDDCGDCEVCSSEGACIMAEKGAECFYYYLGHPTGYCDEHGACQECVKYTATSDTCPPLGTCGTNSKCKCDTGYLPCLLSNGEIQCSATVLTLCADTKCAKHLDLCPGSFTNLTNFLWDDTTVNVKVTTALTFSLYLYGNTGYRSLVKSILSFVGDYNYYTENANKYLNKDILSLKLIGVH